MATPSPTDMFPPSITSSSATTSQLTIEETLRMHGYALGAQIGKGSFGVVYKIREITTNSEMAVKVLDLAVLRMRQEESRILREIGVMQQLHHPNIVRLIDFIHTSDLLCLIMELVDGVDLFDTIVVLKAFEEDSARFVFYQICSALGYMHFKGILHRDVKPENILLERCTTSTRAVQSGRIPPDTTIKLVDFGLSKYGDEQMSFAGTPLYIAPEIIQLGEMQRRQRRDGGDDATTTSSASRHPLRGYSTPADCYSAGMVLFVMLVGAFPTFDSEGRIKFEGKASRVSPLARDLVLGLTHLDPDRRVSMVAALKHEWIRPVVQAMQDEDAKLATTGDDCMNKMATFLSFQKEMIKQEKKITRTQAAIPLPPPFHGRSPAAVSPRPSTVAPRHQQQPVPSPPPPPGGTSSTAVAAASASALRATAESSRAPTTTTTTTTTINSDLLHFNPERLSLLQTSLDTAFQAAYETSPPELFQRLRDLSNNTKELLSESHKTIVNLGHTAVSALDILPDTRLSVEEGETDAVALNLESLKAWTEALAVKVQSLLTENKHALGIVNGCIETACELGSENTSQQLVKVEHLLQNHAAFWDSIDINIQHLLQKTIHISGMISLIRNPRLKDRFLQRVTEYQASWRQIMVRCSTPILKNNAPLSWAQREEMEGGGRGNNASGGGVMSSVFSSLVAGGGGGGSGILHGEASTATNGTAASSATTTSSTTSQLAPLFVSKVKLL